MSSRFRTDDPKRRRQGAPPPREARQPVVTGSVVSGGSSDRQPGARRSLTHVGGVVETGGDAKRAEMLSRALQVAGALDVADGDGGRDGEAATRAHVHGFHTYPARLHPDTASRLVRDFAPAGGRVLDPFCGSGTVLVEGMLAGRNVVGTDLNPIAVLLARLKSAPQSEDEAARIMSAARGAAASADARRQARAGATRRLPAEDVELFDPHVLLELDSLRAAIEGEPAGVVRDALFAVLAALLVKVSKKRGDTATGNQGKRIASGFVSRFFVKKADDLTTRRRDLVALLPKPPPRSEVRIDDAAELRSVPAGSIDAIISSPPYAATYDYLEHHALRLRWLGLDERPLARREFGARRSYVRLDPDAANAKWQGELSAFLRAARRVVRPGGCVVLVLGDSAIRAPRGGAIALRAEDVVAAAARDVGLVPLARASQPRPHFHGPTLSAFRSRARHEHALLLGRDRE
ncbi:MAG: hypothetical protein IPG50_39210 [Myxococcales bacterium]|nr:hypothetical protein [Myxococcales bacterium]